MTSRKKKRQQDGFIKKVSSLFNLDTVSVVLQRAMIFCLFIIDEMDLCIEYGHLLMNIKVVTFISTIRNIKLFYNHVFL